MVISKAWWLRSPLSMLPYIRDADFRTKATLDQ
jgi:hypothetical protein